MTVKCPKCKSENPDESAFCGKCGTRFEAEVSHTKTIETPAEELTTGSTFAGRYQIIEELGKGGMGKVYKVLDKEVQAKMALKLIRPEIAADEKTIERFRNELKTARDVTHKNVCRMYDLNKDNGSYYITMEYVSGGDLKNFIRRAAPLSTARAVSIAVQICEGLAEAHSHGIVHRDLKPSNIMIDDSGCVRIMDFGIARLVKGKGITGAGVMIGTPEYMSPEQVEAKDIDQRSDIYSLGVILYEMTTGQLPFKADSPFALGIKHKNEIPKDPRHLNSQIPEGLNRIILKCLEKEKENRCQSAGEVGSELKRIEQLLPTAERVEPKKPSSTSKEITVSFGLNKLVIPILIIAAVITLIAVLLNILPKKESVSVSANRSSIAVLPFEDLSPQRDQEYFCDGMTDEIIAKLSTLEGLKVISRSSVMRYKNTEIDVREIGQNLGVGTILEGSVRKEDDNIRVTTQLVNVEDRFQIWTETYNQKLERVFDIQSNIAENIVIALRTELSVEDGERLQRKPTENLEAYRLYLQGRYFLNKTTVEGLKKSVLYFEEAVNEDPAFGLAYAGLADSYNLLGGYEFLRPREVYPKARAAALKALEIDDEIAEAHISLGWNKFRFELDWAGSEREFKRGLELNNNYAGAHSWYSMYLLHVGRYEEAVAESELAKELDPLALGKITQVGFNLFVSGRYEEAVDRLKIAMEMDPNYPWAHSVLGEVYERQGLYMEAIASYQKAIDLYGDSPSLFMGFLGHAYAMDGQTERAKEILSELQKLSKQKYVSLFALAIIHLGMGDQDRAFDLFEEAFEERSTQMTSLKFEFRFDNVRSDPRFKALLAKAGL